MTKQGLVHVYTGKGKGKTTAALGIALRAAGWGQKTCVFQFLKKGASGEKHTASLLAGKLTVITFDQTHPMFYPKEVRDKVNERLKRRVAYDMAIVKEELLVGNYDIVILDEIINCLDQKFIKKSEILQLINMKLRKCELILTGRGAPTWLRKKAHYFTEMRLLKHPYNKGLPARKGIDY